MVLSRFGSCKAPTYEEPIQVSTKSGVGRRRFLWAAGASVLSCSPLARAAKLAAPCRALRVGILLPNSARYPEFSERLLAGLRLYAAGDEARSLGPALAIVPVAEGEGPGARFRAAAASIRSGAVDVLAAVADRDLELRLEPLLAQCRVPLVAADVGADVPRMRRIVPHAARHSLGYWQANYAMGRWSAGHLGARVLIAADFLESGYDMVYAFRHAFESHGGEVAAVKVTGLPEGRGPFAEVAQAVRDHRPDFVYALYSGRRAQAFLRFYEADGLARTTPLAGPALLAEPALGVHAQAGFDGVLTASPWAADVAHARGHSLDRAWREVHGAEPDLFAVLGFETAQRIAWAARQTGGTARTEAFARAVEAAQCTAPRAGVAADAAMGEACAPAYVRRLSRSGAGAANTTIDVLPPIALGAGVQHELRTMRKSGWARPYLTT